MKKPRVLPLQPDELNEDQAALLKPYTNKQGEYPNVFGTLARHMDLVNAWSGFGLYTMQHSKVDPILREVAILSAAKHIGSEYEWIHHCDIGRRIGMQEADFDAIQNEQPLDSDEKNLIVQCANDLNTDACLSDHTWAKMEASFGVNYTLDIIFTIGAYRTLGMALNSCGVALE